MTKENEDNKDVVTKAELEAIKTQAAADKAALEAELIATRKSRAEDREALQALLKDDKDDKDESPETPDVEKTVDAILKKREAEKLKKSRAEVLARFKNSKTEFNEANDPAGLKFKVYEKELAKFNLDNVSDEEGFEERFNDVYQYMKRKENREDGDLNHRFAASSSNAGGKDPKSEDLNTLSPVEKLLIDKQGWSKERYLKLKSKQPAYVGSLLRLLNK